MYTYIVYLICLDAAHWLSVISTQWKEPHIVHLHSKADHLVLYSQQSRRQNGNYTRNGTSTCMSYFLNLKAQENVPGKGQI